MRSVPSCDGSALMYGLSYASGIWDEVVSHPVWLSYVCTFHSGILPYICAKARLRLYTVTLRIHFGSSLSRLGICRCALFSDQWIHLLFFVYAFCSD